MPTLTKDGAVRASFPRKCLKTNREIHGTELRRMQKYTSVKKINMKKTVLSLLAK